MIVSTVAFVAPGSQTVDPRMNSEPWTPSEPPLAPIDRESVAVEGSQVHDEAPTAGPIKTEAVATKASDTTPICVRPIRFSPGTSHLHPLKMPNRSI